MQCGYIKPERTPCQEEAERGIFSLPAKLVAIAWDISVCICGENTMGSQDKEEKSIDERETAINIAVRDVVEKNEEREFFVHCIYLL